MTAKDFIYAKYPHLKSRISGKNPIIDFELIPLCEWFEEYAKIKVIETNKIALAKIDAYLFEQENHPIKRSEERMATIKAAVHWCRHALEKSII